MGATKSVINIKWDIKRRLEFIEHHIYWIGPLHRRHLTDAFGTSAVQASKDLSLYKKMAPNNLEFDSSKKCYFISDQFTPKFISIEPHAFLSDLIAAQTGFFSVETSLPGRELPPTEVVPSAYRKIDTKTLREVLRAIRKNIDIEIRYQSMTSPDPTWRWITPHAICFDGSRWHVRSFCHMTKTFKDFLLIRILKIGEKKPSSVDIAEDRDWFEEITIEFGVNPALSDNQKKVIELDFDMKNGKSFQSVKKSSVYYFCKKMGFHRSGDYILDDENQVVLLNYQKIKDFLPADYNHGLAGTS
jgi:predicted DNA-binding transcriptional regulator YafY